MRPKKAVRAALAGTRRDPLDVDRLVGTIAHSPNTLLRPAATAAAQPKTRPQITVRRFQTRQLTVGRWPYQRIVVVVTVKSLILREVAQ
jgi:hypothetical protein